MTPATKNASAGTWHPRSELRDLIESMPDRNFDRVLLLAKTVLKVPFAIVSFLRSPDQNRIQILHDLDGPRAQALNSVIDFSEGSDQPVVIPDVLLDPRTKSFQLKLGDSEIRFYAGVPLITSNGFKFGVLSIADSAPHEFGAEQTEIFKVLAELIVDELELRNLAGNDSLTGAITRRSFSDRSNRALKAARSRSLVSSFVMLDIDYFKAVNDSYGHAFGDRILIAIVDIIRAILPSRDAVARFGGEEFGFLLTDTPLEAALAITRQVQDAISAMMFKINDTNVSVTASFGATEISVNDLSFDACYNRADRALYMAKNAGRNRIAICSGNELAEV